jgi:uncharacterized repeat protein (TIGR01451 family)
VKLSRALLLIRLLILILSTTAAFAQPSYQVQKTGPANVGSGDTITYTIVVRNDGSTGDATLHDPLPAGTVFDSLASPAGWSCTTPAVGANGTVFCTNAAFAGGTVDTFTLVVDTDGIASGTAVTNTATVTGTDVEPRSSTATTTVDSADLRVTKSGDGTTSAGGSISYSITVTNGGFADSSVTLTDPLPAGTTFTSIVIPSGWSCTTPAAGTNGTVQCSTAVMAAEEEATFTLVVAVDGGAQPGDTFTNTATVSGPLFDPDLTSNSASATTLIPDPGATDLYVTKSAPATASAAETFDYTVVVGNADAAAILDVSLSDPLPAGTTFQAITYPVDWSCTTPSAGTNGSIDCSAATLAGNATAAFIITVRVDNSVAAGTVVTNTAEGGTESQQNDPSNDTASANTTIVTAPSVGVTVSDSPDPVAAGNDLTYTIEVGNEGSDAPDVTLTFTPPPATTFVSLAPAAGWSCTTPAAGASGPITCTIATLPAGGATFTVVQHVPPGTANGAILTATAEVAHAGSDAEPTDDTATATTTVIVQATFTVTKKAPATVTAGNNLSYTIDVTNDGPSDAAVTLSDDVVAPATFASFAAPAGWSCATPAVGASGNVSCSIATLAGTATASFTLVVNVPAGTAGGTVLTNTANAGGGSDTATTTVLAAPVPEADLNVTKSGPATAASNSTVAYTITVTNDGPDAAANVTLTDILSAPFVSLASPAGWSCTTPAAGATGTVTCTIASLANAAVPTFTLFVTAPAAPATLTNTASVSSTTADADGSDNAAVATTNIATGADLHVTKTGPATAIANSTVAYTITVTNDGPDAAANVTLTDILSAPFVSLASPAGWSCTTPAAGATGTVTCTIASLPNAAVATFTLSVTAPPAPASLTNTASVTSTTPDGDAADNASTAATTITAAPAPAAAVPTLSPALLALMAVALAAIALKR